LQGGQAVDRLAERVARRHPALIHRRRRRRGKADHVADGVDVVDLGPEVRVDEDATAGVGLQADGLQLEVLGLALAARGVRRIGLRRVNNAMAPCVVPSWGLMHSRAVAAPRRRRADGGSCQRRGMTKKKRDCELNRPGAVIAALPAVLGFVPEKSLVLLSIDAGELGSVMRVDLSDTVADQIGHLAEVAAAGTPEAAIAVIVDEDGAGCPVCTGVGSTHGEPTCRQ
jgi:hypothetical protein